MSKRDRNYFEESDDEDYLIEQSLAFDQEEEILRFDDYMNSRPELIPPPVEEPVEQPTRETPAYDIPLYDKPLYDFDDEEDEPLFLTPTVTNKQPTRPTASQPSIVQDMNSMDISDHEMEEEEIEVDLGRDTELERILGEKTPFAAAKSKKVKKVDYTIVPEEGAFVSAICPTTGRYIYFSKKSIGTRRNKKDALFKEINSSRSKGLLMKPIWQLMRDIELENHAELQRLEKEKEDEEARKNKKKKVVKDESGMLWVDKYRPKTYMDLMGDQRLNRDVMRWVKQWDFCVFKKKSQQSQRDKVMRQYKDKFEHNPRFNAFHEKKENTDPLQRPERKILLMSGPPGFGKTTLAHVIAKQAGYNIIEINASDDRTGEVVKSKIKAALEMQAIIRESSTGDGKMTMTQKPNLLIIDEIDGASASGGGESFIKQLVQLASVEVNDPKKKGKSKEIPLMRPIICICNDAYAPVLRPLRMIAQNITFKKVPMMSVAKRLQDICDLEGLDSDLRTLSSLAETTDGDIRSCLNTLQFVRGKSTSFTKDMLAKAGVGSKDMGKSLFTVWEDLFCAPNARHKSSVDDFDSNKYLGRLTNTVMGSGDIDRIMQGCFEAYPLMRFHDTAMQKFCQISEWLEFYDLANHRTNARHEYEFYKYLPYPVVNFHRFFAGSTIQEHRVEYPRVDYEVFSTKKTFENLVAVFMSGIHVSKRRYLNRDMIANELVPMLIHIISPELKPTNMQVIKPAEKAKLARLVDVMIEFGLTFIQEKMDDNQFMFKLEPPIEQLLNFELCPQMTVLPKQYAVRQMISHEVETELIRRREEASQLRNGGNTNKVTELDKIKESESLKVKDQKEEKVALDFFGREIVPKPEKADKPFKSVKMEVDTPKTHVNYRYHEGFSNAVRKPMTVQMFL